MPKLERTDGTLEIPTELPVVALRDLVFFPYMVLPLLIGRPRSSAALREAEEGEGLLVFLAQRDANVESPGHEDLNEIGTVVRVLEVTRLADETARVVLEGLGRVRITAFLGEDGHEEPFRARVEAHPAGEALPEETRQDAAIVARTRRLRRAFDEYVRMSPAVPTEVARAVGDVADPVRFAQVVAGHLLAPASEKQELLATETPEGLLEATERLLSRELEILKIEEQLDEQLRDRQSAPGNELQLPDHLRMLQRDLSEEENEWAEMEQRITDASLPALVQERVEREIVRLKRLNPISPEASVIRTFVDCILDLPWARKTVDILDIAHASAILEAAHYGLGEVKERILDHIAVLSLVKELEGPVLCLVGPPGVGKTSLGKSIADALGREFVRVSLGGVRDEAEIRGHRRTYVGALPGRIIQGIRKGGSRNPVVLLDEIDKLSADVHGDPASALLEVLDPEQNGAFTDHYLEVGFDLSDVLFLTTANHLAGIPDPLRDRMEIIRLPGYLDTEKREIARRFIWPRQAAAHGLDPQLIEMADEAITLVIDRYTREAGVRELDRRLSRVARKMARRTAEGVVSAGDSITLGPDDLRDLLGPEPHSRSKRDGVDRAGIANGLAWTSVGGVIMDVEVAVVPGSGKIQLTGTLGDVMKESAIAAVTYTRSRAALLGLDANFHRELDLHIHLPEGATPKDGPSAGITIAVALISALTDTPTFADIAMTGEITLRGRVLPVGGIKEKCVAALRGGIRRVVLPAENASDLELLPDEVRQGLEFVPVATMDAVLEATLGARSGLADAGRGAIDLGSGSGIGISQ